MPTPTNPLNSPSSSGKSKLDQFIELAGKFAILTGKVGVPYVSLGMEAAKLLIGLFNRNAPAAEQIILDKEKERAAILSFIESAQLGQAEGREYLDRWERETDEPH